MIAADYAAVATTTANVTAGPGGGDGIASCAICRGPISTGTTIHKLIPKTGGSHVYVHEGCWP